MIKLLEASFVEGVQLGSTCRTLVRSHEFDITADADGRFITVRFLDGTRPVLVPMANVRYLVPAPDEAATPKVAAKRGK